MKVREIAKRFSAASEGKFVLIQTSASGYGTVGKHSFDSRGVQGLLDNEAPILDMTVGLIYVSGSDLVVTAYRR